MKSSTPKPHYGFRRGTQGRRPGIEAGLGKRTQADIQEAAEKKKKQKLAKRDQESQAKVAVEAHEAAGMTAVAVMLDRRAQREAQELAELDNIPPSDEENPSGCESEYALRSKAVC